MERIVKKSRTFRAADAWNIEQCRALTPGQRLQIAAALKRRAWPRPMPDVKACHRPS